MLRILLLLLAALTLQSGPAASAAPTPPQPGTGQAVPVEWALEGDGSVTIRFAADEGVDPDLLARLDAALLRPQFPILYWTVDPRTGRDHLAFDVGDASPTTK